MKQLILRIALVFLSVNSFSQANGAPNEDPAKTLILMIESDKIAIQMLDMMIPEFKKMVPDVPEVFWTRFKDAVDIDDFVINLAPIYKKHFTDEELGQLIDFYSTRVGQKLIQESPAIMQESYAVGQRWGEEIAAVLLETLAEEGYQIQ